MTADRMDIEPVRTRNYTVEQVDTSLLQLALNGGNATKTAEQLAEQGIEIDDTTLRKWRSGVYPRRYQWVMDTYYPQIEADIVRGQREIIVRSDQVSLTALDKVAEELGAGTVKDPAKAFQALQTGKGIATDKMLLLTDRPNHIVDNVSPEAALNKIGRLLGLAPDVVDATAEPLPPAAELTTGPEGEPQSE